MAKRIGMATADVGPIAKEKAPVRAPSPAPA